MIRISAVVLKLALKIAVLTKWWYFVQLAFWILPVKGFIGLDKGKTINHWISGQVAAADARLWLKLRYKSDLNLLLNKKDPPSSPRQTRGRWLAALMPHNCAHYNMSYRDRELELIRLTWKPETSWLQGGIWRLGAWKKKNQFTKSYLIMTLSWGKMTLTLQSPSCAANAMTDVFIRSSFSPYINIKIVWSSFYFLLYLIALLNKRENLKKCLRVYCAVFQKTL